MQENKLRFVEAIKTDFLNKKKHNKTSVEKLALSFGIDNKNLVKELTELAIVKIAKSIVAKQLPIYSTYLQIVDLYNTQVNLSQRTSESMRLQQYSTPCPISYMAGVYVLGSHALNGSGYKAFKNIALSDRAFKEKYGQNPRSEKDKNYILINDTNSDEPYKIKVGDMFEYHDKYDWTTGIATRFEKDENSGTNENSLLYYKPLPIWVSKREDWLNKMDEQVMSKFQAFKIGNNIKKVSLYKKIYFEPSAGNGLLTIALPENQVIVNELDEIRLENLKTQSFIKVLNQDASIPFKGYERYFEGIVTNPPFGTLSTPVKYDNFEITTLDHLMCLRALDCMQDNGRAAMIIGGHTKYDEQGRIQKGKNRIFFNFLYSHYNVEDVIMLNGHKIYSRQGTAFDTRLILINGRKKNIEGFAPLKTDADVQVNSFDEFWERMNTNLHLDPKKDFNGIKIKLKLQKMKLKLLDIEDNKKDNLVLKYANISVDKYNASLETYKNSYLKLQKLIDEKKYDELKNMLWSGNKLSKKFFSEYTNLELPNTDKGTFEILKNYTGYIEPIIEKKQKLTKEEVAAKMQQARDSKTLDAKFNYTGYGVLSRRDFIEKLISDGAYFETEQVDAIKDITRRAYNRMNYQQQEAYEIKKEKAGKKTEYRIFKKNGSFYTITKAEYEYGLNLKNQ